MIINTPSDTLKCEESMHMSYENMVRVHQLGKDLREKCLQAIATAPDGGLTDWLELFALVDDLGFETMNWF